MHPFMMTATSEDSDDLPTSVRGAPPELRRMIRKRQNSESAKRCRQRKKLESARATQELAMHANHLARLEHIVQDLARRVDATATVVAQLASQMNPSQQLPAPLPPMPRPAPDAQQLRLYDEVAAIVA